MDGTGQQTARRICRVARIHWARTGEDIVCIGKEGCAQVLKSEKDGHAHGRVSEWCSGSLLWFVVVFSSCVIYFVHLIEGPAMDILV